MYLMPNIQRQGKSIATRLAPKKGENTRDIGERILADQAVSIENYFVTGDGRLITRGGFTITKEQTLQKPSFIRAISDTLFVYGYVDTVQKVASYNSATDTTTAIKSFSTDTPCTVDVNDSKVYIANGDEKIGYTDGTTWSQLTNAPVAKHIVFYEFSGYTFLVANDGKVVKWSKGNNFNNWTETTAKPVDDPGKITNERLGEIMSIGTQDKYLFILYENAINAYHFIARNADGYGLAQVVLKDFESTVISGYTGIGFDLGFAYTHAKGVSILNVVQGDKDVFELSDILGEARMTDLYFNLSKVFYDGIDRLFISCGTAQGQNNYVLVYNIKFSAWTSIPDWNIADFTLVGNNIYAIGSYGDIIKLFDGYSDGGVVINYRVLYREESLGDTNNLKNLDVFRIESVLSPSSEITISFNTWDITGTNTEEGRKYCQKGNTDTLSGDNGVGKLAVGKLGYLESSDNVVSSDYSVRFYNIRKVQVELTSSSDVPHEIRMVQLEWLTGRRIYQRNLCKK